MNRLNILIGFALLLISTLITALWWTYIHPDFDVQLRNCTEMEDLNERFNCQYSLKDAASTIQEKVEIEDILGNTEFLRLNLEAAKIHFKKAFHLCPEEEKDEKARIGREIEAINGLLEK